MKRYVKTSLCKPSFWLLDAGDGPLRVIDWEGAAIQSNGETIYVAARHETDGEVDFVVHSSDEADWLREHGYDWVSELPRVFAGELFSPSGVVAIDQGDGYERILECPAGKPWTTVIIALDDLKFASRVAITLREGRFEA